MDGDQRNLPRVGWLRRRTSGSDDDLLARVLPALHSLVRTQLRRLCGLQQAEEGGQSERVSRAPSCWRFRAVVQGSSSSRNGAEMRYEALLDGEG